jgi:predicted metal-dependent phosphoesterase TrpH
MSVDLHLHTTASDGCMSPREVVEMAANLGLHAIAVSDHDTVAGVDEARLAGNELGVEVIPALEFSSRYYSRDIHILGYFVSLDAVQLHTYIKRLRKARSERIVKIVDCLREHSIDINVDDVRSVAGQASIGRPHIARVLLEKGFVKDFSEAFQKYLRRDALCYIEKFVYPPDKLISLIHQIGGVAVFAHPGHSGLDDYIPELVAMGIDGLEAYHSDHSEQVREHYVRLAAEHGLIVTGGSDCHGRVSTHGIRMGTNYVPDEVVDQLRARKAEKAAKIKT